MVIAILMLLSTTYMGFGKVKKSIDGVHNGNALCVQVHVLNVTFMHWDWMLHNLAPHTLFQILKTATSMLIPDTSKI